MAIGERIRFFRRKKGLTQKQLGIELGFSSATADIRVAQYESGKRTPKADTIEKLAEIFDVSTAAITIPDIDSQMGIMQTLFALEDIYGLTVNIRDEGCIAIMTTPERNDDGLNANLYEWARKCDQHRSGSITEEEYDAWRYKSSEFIDYQNSKKI